MPYKAHERRYDKMLYRRCGNSGLLLPAISLGLWHNFGGVDDIKNAEKMILRAFDLGITHFDLANNYGPPPGTAELNFGRIFKKNMKSYRDEMIISSKAGYRMWPGPYGEWGSRKNLIASVDQSLKRMGLDYVDIFYSHRFDPNTPLEETMAALDTIVKQGKALYVGISSGYNAVEAGKAFGILRSLGTPCLIQQPSYSILNRSIETGLLNVLEQEQVGCIVFSPLAQGLLSNRYLKGIPKGSRASKPHGFLKKERITPEIMAKVNLLNQIALKRGQTLAEMAVAWILRTQVITSVLVGASRVSQIEDNVKALENLVFSHEELEAIDSICPVA